MTTRFVFTTLVLLAALAAGMPGARAQTAAPEISQVETMAPYKMVRTLEYVQDSVVGGDHAAMAMQRYLLGAIDKRLQNADTAIFDDSRNVDAALIYAMSGGNPATLDLLASKDAAGNFDHKLVVALKAYLSGQPQHALPMLKTLRKQFRASPIEPYLTLVTANATALGDPKAALGLFDWVRLLAPGSILEESALRREIALSNKLHMVDMGMDYSRIYAARFVHSPYAGQFANLFVRLVVDNTETVDQHAVAQVLADMDAGRQSAIYLRIARAAVIDGKTTTAATSAKRAGALGSADDPVTKILSGFYGDVARLTSSDTETAMKSIEAVPQASLSTRDKALRTAALAVGEMVMRPAGSIAKNHRGGMSDHAQPVTPHSKTIYSKTGSATGRPPTHGRIAEQGKENGAFKTFVDTGHARLKAIDALLEEDKR